MDKVKAKVGDTGGADTNFTLQRLINLKNIACGLSLKDIKNISRDSECVDKMNAISQSSCVDQEQVSTIHLINKMKMTFFMTSLFLWYILQFFGRYNFC